ncbi:MAG: hypothetical protein EXR25_12435 [Limnohabitans sp.]|nr:hypothetical protein [Limnohabitans sp.]
MSEPIPLPTALQSPVAVVCHDAGAAHLVFAWLRHWCEAGLLAQHSFNLVLQGPAEKAWQHHPVPLPQVQFHSSPEAALKGCCSVLTGTGWASNLEHHAREMAASLGITSIAVIDHWVNYALRFERDGVVVMPTQIWVSDADAASMAHAQFKSVPVLELPNVYLQQLVSQIPLVPSDCRNLLYVLEPVRNDWGRGGQGEFQALDFFVQNIKQVVGNKPVQIILRPHPSDPANKYKAWMKANESLEICLDQQMDLNQSIAQARWVVGVESFALVVAHAAGRETFSSLPPWAHRCRLPIQGLVHMQDTT